MRHATALDFAAYVDAFVVPNVPTRPDHDDLTRLFSLSLHCVSPFWFTSTLVEKPAALKPFDAALLSSYYVSISDSHSTIEAWLLFAPESSKSLNRIFGLFSSGKSKASPDNLD